MSAVMNGSPSKTISRNVRRKARGGHLKVISLARDYEDDVRDVRSRTTTRRACRTAETTSGDDPIVADRFDAVIPLGIRLVNCKAPPPTTGAPSGLAQTDVASGVNPLSGSCMLLCLLIGLTPRVVRRVDVFSSGVPWSLNSFNEGQDRGLVSRLS